MLPARRQPQRSGIARAPKREWPRHRKFVRSHECSVPCCCAATYDALVSIEFAHVRGGTDGVTDGGTGIKPSDWWGISLCVPHHREQHQIGEAAFEKLHGINMKKLAAEFAKASPDVAMKLAMKEAGIV